MQRWSTPLACFALLLVGRTSQAATSKDANSAAFVLSSTCPASFIADEHGGCRLISLYQAYESPHGIGVGGLKTGLPTLRDGFTAEQIDLGRYLFFDPLLSGDQSVACSSCHDPALGFADGRALARGIDGRTTQRSAPSLWNVGFLTRLKWDASAESLEAQMLGPLYADNEMGNTPEQLISRLRQDEHYPALVRQAFDSAKIELEQVYTALAAFESSLISLNSRYDLYAHGLHSALTLAEIKGMNVFRSFVARCAECHTPPLFTNQQLAVLGVPERDGKPLDPGAQAASGDPSQRAAFKVPSLRNITKTAPYMHAGNFDTLFEAIAFYSGGRGHAVPEGESLNLHWHVWNPGLSDAEVDAVIDFLDALTDEGFMPEIPDKVPSGLTPGRAPGSATDLHSSNSAVTLNENNNR